MVLLFSQYWVQGNSWDCSERVRQLMTGAKHDTHHLTSAAFSILKRLPCHHLHPRPALYPAAPARLQLPYPAILIGQYSSHSQPIVHNHNCRQAARQSWMCAHVCLEEQLFHSHDTIQESTVYICYVLWMFSTTTISLVPTCFTVTVSIASVCKVLLCGQDTTVTTDGVITCSW